MVFQSIQHLTIQPLKIFGNPLYNLLNYKKNITFRSRKTLPCTKGIKTPNSPSNAFLNGGRKTLPCTKGIKILKWGWHINPPRWLKKIIL